MNHDLYSFLALDEKEESLEDVVNAKNKYAILKKTHWSLKAQVMATGLGFDDKFFKHYKDALKNGREKDKKGLLKRDGYPSLLKKTTETVEDQLFQFWKETLFQPTPEQWGKLPLYSYLLRIDLKLISPFYSRDDLVFYPIENPIKKEWVFKTPYLSSSGVKGLLRWAWRLFHEDLKTKEEEFLFGPRSEGINNDNARQGALYFYPLFWNANVSFEVINPHDRKTGVGINPIKYEVVPANGESSLFLSFVNREEDLSFAIETLEDLKEPLFYLLENSGLSAKRSSGWGNVEIRGCETLICLPKSMTSLLQKEKLADKTDPWVEVVDEIGQLLPFENVKFTTDRLSKISGITKTQVKKDKEAAKRKILELWERKKEETVFLHQEDKHPSGKEPYSIASSTVTDLLEKLQKDLIILRNASMV